MADPRKALALNIPADPGGHPFGGFFVDSTCINCDTCRQLAPEVFTESHDNFSFVNTQPTEPEDVRNALRALLACPTGSIGTYADNTAKDIIGDFPLLIDTDVFYCGFASPRSYGASSYFIRHADGNWLIDSPKFIPHLVKRFEDMGGLSYIFLTHRDDVADAERYAERFGAKRIIHRKELSAQPDAEIVLDGDESTPLLPDFLAIPTPGHTRGHCVLLYSHHPDNSKLFTGDHLWWSRVRNRLHASEAVCWYDWDTQIQSLVRLLQFEFTWILPGHGQRHHAPKDVLLNDLRRLIADLTQGTILDDTW
jgi:glyoxylase-like metal-dependent hydrolase (beta-lactamase superfamily II)